VAEILLSLKNITKSFDGVTVLKDISLDIMKGEFVTLLGPSGCGKTTTLRIIAGLEQPDHGSVILEGRDVTHLAPEKRHVNTVFQSYALFPHMNVSKNIAYGPRLQGMDKSQINERVKEMLRLVQLEGFERRMPSELSGGQRQRIAIARAIINNPALLLLDEPLGALDLQLRRQMQTELKALQSKLGITFIYITHDQEEALNMSDRIVVMNDGQFEQIGTPEEIYERPVTRFAARFIGNTNIVEGVVQTVDGSICKVKVGDGTIIVAHDSLSAGEHIALSVRAERIDYADQSQYGFALPGTIKSHSYIGGVLRTIITLQTGQELFITGANPTDQYPVGCAVQIFWDPATAAVVERG